MSMNKIPAEAVTGLYPEEISQRLEIPSMRGVQIFQWLHRKRVFDVQAMTNMPKAERARIAREPALTALAPVVWQEAEKSGTVKGLFELQDRETIESVLLTQGTRLTFCLSSQAGCALGCTFCATGRAGFRRDLLASEIIEQALRLAERVQLREENTPNIVLMGMGEPFQNYDAVMKAIRLLMHPEGMHIGARKITISTVGAVPGILRFAEEPWQVRLSISLHAADNELRSQLVPFNRRHSLEELHEALRTYQEKRGRQITIEWVLIQDINDGAAHAKALAKYLRGLDAVVNLIPWNAVSGLAWHPSPPENRKRFMEILEKAGIKATLRRERGDDIEAACGQLRNIRGNRERLDIDCANDAGKP